MQDHSDAHRLATMDPLFAGLLETNGVPPQWRRTASFGTLVRLVLEQQVSLASAKAAYMRLTDRIGEPTTSEFLKLPDDGLKAIGFSRQKTRYVRGIAQSLNDGTLDLVRVIEAGWAGRDELLSVTGIGPWTVSCFLLFVAGEADVWPTGDRALYVSMTRNLGLSEVPEAAACDALAAEWSPYRSTAARMLWHDYLGGPDYKEDPDAGFVNDMGMVSL